MEIDTSYAEKTTASRTCHYGLWLSSSEKQRLKHIAEKENFVSISQFIRQRCLNEALTNSEFVNELMTQIAQKIEIECAKLYSHLKEKEYTKEMLKPPKIVSPPRKEKSGKIKEKSLPEKKINKKPKRSCYMGLALTKEERVQLKKNATKGGFKVISKYVRDRCLREQITKTDAINMILAFMEIKFAEGLLSPDRKLEWRKQSVKKRMNMSFITLGMDQKKKQKFEKDYQELAETYSKELQQELTSILLAQKQKIESGASC